MLKKSENIQTTRRVNIETINADMNLNMRVGSHKDTIAEYAEAMKLGEEFPPLDCAEVDGELMLYDGFLRYNAYKKQRITDVVVRSRIGTHDDAVLWAVEANAYQGLKRTNDDKRRSVVKLLETEKSRGMTNEEIANAAGVVPSTVHVYRQKLGRDKVDSNLSLGKKPDQTRIDKLGRKRPTTYAPRKPRDASASRPAPRPAPKDAKPSSQPGSRTYVPPYEKMQWPTDAEIGKPPPELQNEPHPDYPGMTYLQVFRKENPGYTHALPLDRKRKEEAKIATQEIIGRIREIGAACKVLSATLPGRVNVETFAALLNESSLLWKSKFDQHRTDIEVMWPIIRDVLDRTRRDSK